MPSIEAFYSDIRGEGIIEQDFKHGEEVFETFELKNLGEYHDLYLKTDVVLLCDVLEQFRTMCMQKYGLDACHFYSSPGRSWAACLKMTGVRLELLTDIDMINFFERRTRGGVSQISNRYKRANNPMLGEGYYDASEKTSWIQYLDMNAMYSYSMTSPLPIGYFRFLSEEELKTFDILSIADDSPLGYVCEVSLAYPTHLHQKHVDLPLAPVRKCIRNEELSPYAGKLWNKLYGEKDNKTENQTALNRAADVGPDEMAGRASVEKLVTTFEDRDRYVSHIETCVFIKSLGWRYGKFTVS